MRNEDAVRLGNVLIGKLQDFGVRQKCSIAGKAGMELGEVPEKQQNMFVDSSIRRAFTKLNTEEKVKVLPILAEQIISTTDGIGRQELTTLLGHHGYEFINGAFVPVGLIDEREAQHLPPTTASELARAISRLSDIGGESGAITSACGAVDLATSAAYEKCGLGKLPNSFQTRVNVVMERLQIYEEIEQELVAIKVRPDDAKKIADETHEAIKHAANALELIRRTQADAHGTRPAYRRIAYDAIKWSSAICGLLDGKI